MRRTIAVATLAVTALSLLGEAGARQAASAPEGVLVAQASFEERKEDFVVQTRNEVLTLRNQVQRFRRMLGEGGKPDFEAAQKDFEAKAAVLLQKLDEVGALPPQQARARKFEVDAAYQALQAAYDRVVQVTD